MRMWMLPPEKLCRKHLLGEHVEIHMLAGSLFRGKNISGFIGKGLLEPAAMLERHAALAAEMERRGYRHSSPLEADRLAAAQNQYPAEVLAARVDCAQSAADLIARCPECAAKLKGPPDVLSNDP